MEGAEAGVGGLVELDEAVADEDAVFTDEGDDVGDGGGGDEVEEVFEIEGGGACFEEGVGDFKGDAGGAEVGELVAAFGVNEGVAVWFSVG